MKISAIPLRITPPAASDRLLVSSGDTVHTVAYSTLLSGLEGRGKFADAYFGHIDSEGNVDSAGERTALVLDFITNEGSHQLYTLPLPSAEGNASGLGCISHEDWLKIQTALSGVNNLSELRQSDLHTLSALQVTTNTLSATALWRCDGICATVADVPLSPATVGRTYWVEAPGRFYKVEKVGGTRQAIEATGAVIYDGSHLYICNGDLYRVTTPETGSTAYRFVRLVNALDYSALEQRGKFLNGWFGDSALTLRFLANDGSTQEKSFNLPAAASAEGSTLGCISHDDWVKIQDLNWYGVEWSTDNSNPACTRIGNMEMHRTLPIQSKMRGCLLNDDGEVVEYLPANQWPASLTDGSRGQVMVEIPRHYRRFETHGDIRRVKLSEMPLPGFHEVPTCYVSAYQATCQRSTHKLSSVRNFNEDYMGGNINSTTIAAYNGTPLTRCGRPICSGYRADVRRYARNRGAEGEAHWNIYTYDIHKTITWLFVVEYATRQSQAAYNPELTADGFRQGGLGVGAAFGDSAWWGGDINNLVPGKIGYQSFIPCGVSDTLGNHSGEVAYDVPDINGDVVGKMRVARYRGIEHPWGHLNIILDDVNVLCASSTGGDIFTPTGEATIYITDQPIHFANANYSQYRHHTSAVPSTISDSGGFVTKMAFGDNGEVIAEAVGGDSSAHYCDRFTGLRLDALSNANNSADHMMTQGGSTLSAGNGGIFALSIATNNTYADGAIGTRLTYIP